MSPLSDAGASALSKDKKIGYISVALDVGQGSITEDEANAVLDAANPAKKAGLQVAVGGYVGQELSKPDTGASDKIGILAAMVILLLVFGSAVAMGLPIVTAVLGLLCGLSVVTLLSHIADVPTTAPTLATMIGLAVGIDYSLFIVTKHRTQVAEGMEVRESIARASATAGGAVLFAGGTVAISLLALVVAGIPLVTTLGYTSAIAVVFAILAALTLLPALFGLLGSHVSALQLPFGQAPRRRGAVPVLDEGRHVDREPPLAGDDRRARGPAGSGDTDACPCASARRTSGRSRPTRRRAQSYDLITKGFGAGTNGPFLISVQLSKPAQAGPEEPQHDQSEREAAAAAAAADRAAGAPGGRDPAAGAVGGAAADAAAVQRARQQEEAGRAAGDRPAPPDPANDLQKTKGVKSVTQPLVNKKGTAAVYTLIPNDLALRPRHRGPGLAPEGLDDPEGDQGPGDDGLRRRHDSRVCRPRRQDHQQAASGHPGRRGAQLPRAAGRLPLAPAARPGGRDEPRLGGGGLRRAHARLPGGLRHRA